MRTRFATDPAPLLDLALALATYQRDEPVFARWIRRTGMPREARPLFELMPPSATGPLFLDPVTQGVEDGLATVLSTPLTRVRAELRRTVRPTSWTRLLADGDRDARRVLE